MTMSSLNASAFYEQAVTGGKVFTVTDDGSFLVFRLHGIDVVPFWSSRPRVEKIQMEHPKYAKWTVDEQDLSEFIGKTLTLFKEENVRVGVNWGGKKLTGFDVSADDLKKNLAYSIEKNDKGEQPASADGVPPPANH